MAENRRQATIFAREDGWLITLDKSKFEKIMSIFKEHKIRGNLEFMHKFSFLSELGPSKMLSLLHTTTIVVLHRHHCIFREGDAADALYLLKSGEVALTKIGKLSDQRSIRGRFMISYKLNQERTLHHR